MASADALQWGLTTCSTSWPMSVPAWHADALCRCLAGPPCVPAVSRDDPALLYGLSARDRQEGAGDVKRAELAEAAIILRRLLDAVEAGTVEVDTSGIGLGPREVALLRSVAERIMQSVRERASAVAGEMPSLVEPAQADELADDLQLDGNALWAQATGRLP